LLGLTLNELAKSFSALEAADMSDTPSNSGYSYRQGRDAGWTGKFPVFRATSPEHLLEALKGFVQEASSQQVVAWENSIPSMQQEVGRVLDSDPQSKEFSALLEYLMPMESRRSDAIFLLNDRVLVLEYKDYPRLDWADIDQARYYLSTLKSYHRECHDRKVDAVLVLMGGKMAMLDHSGVHVCGPQEVHKLVARLCSESAGQPIDLERFTAPDAYLPAPALLKGIREIIKEGRLVRVHRSVAKTDEALSVVERVAERSASLKRRSIVLLSGAPGTGKTLVGIRAAVSDKIGTLALPRAGQPNSQAAIFLTGNAPLVSVLKHEFKKHQVDAKALVRNVREYVDYYSNPKRIPPQHFMVFDEAQRAWDAQKVRESQEKKAKKDAKKGKMAKTTEDSSARSEPEMFVWFSERVPEWCTVLGLIGGGQEIHSGEEGGVKQWADAIKASPDSGSWDIYGPMAYAHLFDEAGLGSQYKVEGALFLDRSIRFSGAVHLHEWVSGLVDEGLPDDRLKELAANCKESGVVMRVTRDLEVAKRYLWGRFIKDAEARFGLMISSRDKCLGAYGVPQIGKYLPIGEWYVEDEINPNSCRRLREAITQFEAQGLELDAALVCWGNDFAWTDSKSQGTENHWDISMGKKWKKNSIIRDPLSLRRNTYRVLLTRGRQGSVIFVPPQADLDETYTKLVAAGCETLDHPVGL
jgi:hypothetical protein